MKLRRVLPELLDSLAPDDPQAQRLHSGIEYFNRLLGNYRWFSREIGSYLVPGDRVLEIGAGKGRLLREVTAAIAAGEPQTAKSVSWAGLDLACTAPPDFTGPWFQQSALDFDDYRSFTVVIANHLLHQFSDAELRQLGTQFQGARLLVFSEPWRQWHAGMLAGLSPLIGMPLEAVADGWKSVRAGFRRRELPALLGLCGERWVWEESIQPLGAIRLIARMQG